MLDGFCNRVTESFEEKLDAMTTHLVSENASLRRELEATIKLANENEALYQEYKATVNERDKFRSQRLLGAVKLGAMRKALNKEKAKEAKMSKERKSLAKRSNDHQKRVARLARRANLATT